MRKFFEPRPIQNNKGYGPFKYREKIIPTQWKRLQSSQHNYVISAKQIFEMISWPVNFGNGLISFPENLQTTY